MLRINSTCSGHCILKVSSFNPSCCVSLTACNLFGQKDVKTLGSFLLDLCTGKMALYAYVSGLSTSPANSKNIAVCNNSHSRKRWTGLSHDGMTDWKSYFWSSFFLHILMHSLHMLSIFCPLTLFDNWHQPLTTQLIFLILTFCSVMSVNFFLLLITLFCTTGCVPISTWKLMYNICI